MIIGIDPSLTSTGISCGEVTSRILSKPTEGGDALLGLAERVDQIMADIDTWLLDNCPIRTTYDFFIEGPSYGVTRGGGSHLLEMGFFYAKFIDRIAVLPNGFISVQPATLKKFIGGKGNLPKDEVPLRVFKKWKVEFENDAGKDMAHAFALYKLGMEVRSGNISLEPVQRRGSRRKAVTAARK